jgi:hypothetical protein
MQNYDFACSSVWVWSLRLRVFENRVLRRILRPMREDMTGSWRDLRNQELHILHHRIKMIKSRRMRLAGHVARVKGGWETVYDIGGKAKRKDTTMHA